MPSICSTMTLVRYSIYPALMASNSKVFADQQGPFKWNVSSTSMYLSQRSSIVIMGNCFLRRLSYGTFSTTYFKLLFIWNPRERKSVMSTLATYSSMTRGELRWCLLACCFSHWTTIRRLWSQRWLTLSWVLLNQYSP